MIHRCVLRSVWPYLAVSLLACTTHRSGPGAGDESPQQVLKALGLRLYIIGETSGRVQDFHDAELGAVRAIRAAAARADSSDALVEGSAWGASPLMMAAMNGYSEVVEELLRHPAVKAGINSLDERGRTAWVHANFAFHQAAWVCRPEILQDSGAFVSLLVTLPYYWRPGEAPYRKVRRLLEEAGARTDMDTAKAAWLAVCRPRGNALKEKVATSSDLLETLVAEGMEHFNKPVSPRPKVEVPPGLLASRAAVTGVDLECSARRSENRDLLESTRYQVDTDCIQAGQYETNSCDSWLVGPDAVSRARLLRSETDRACANMPSVLLAPACPAVSAVCTLGRCTGRAAKRPLPSLDIQVVPEDAEGCLWSAMLQLAPQFLVRTSAVTLRFPLSTDGSPPRYLEVVGRHPPDEALLLARAFGACRWMTSSGRHAGAGAWGTMTFRFDD